MGQLRAFAKLITSVRGVDVDFAIVYIAEAHPTDGWMYPAVEQFAYRKQHTQLEDRLVASGVEDWSPPATGDSGRRHWDPALRHAPGERGPAGSLLASRSS